MQTKNSAQAARLIGSIVAILLIAATTTRLANSRPSKLAAEHSTNDANRKDGILTWYAEASVDLSGTYVVKNDSH